jgi:hypothetical protein
MAVEDVIGAVYALAGTGAHSAAATIGGAVSSEV